MTCVISFSLYGDNPFYCQGAIENAKLKKTIYGPEWESWFYVFHDVPAKVVQELEKHADRLFFIEKDFKMQNGMFWRFLPILDESVDIVIVRDTDSRLSLKEKHCVDEWLASDKTFHIIRDAPTHQMPFQGATLGLRKPLPFDIGSIIEESHVFWSQNKYNMDQLFLAHKLYPLSEGNRIVHDSYNQYECDGMIEIPQTERFISERINEYNLPENTDSLNSMSGRYIYFYRNIELYKTEQFGAFLYEFMENLQMARVMKRTLVLPDVFIAPRNNEKILKEKHIYIKELILIPITSLVNLDYLTQHYVKVIPLSEFYELTYNDPAVLFINPEKEKDIADTIKQDKYLYTAFGKIPYSQCVNINSHGLHSISLVQHELYKDFDKHKNWIFVNNGRLGQPNWHQESIGLDYFTIRMGIQYPSHIIRCAREFVMQHNLRKHPTLAVHWRRGDYHLTGEHTNKFEVYEPETNLFYQRHIQLCSPLNLSRNILEIIDSHPEIIQVFLIHNNADVDEVNQLLYILGQCDITVYQYIRPVKDPNVLHEQYEGMVQQIIGAQCKYQLHGPSTYQRMSAFGRWMIEERKRYHFNDAFVTSMEVYNNVFFVNS